MAERRKDRRKNEKKQKLVLPLLSGEKKRQKPKKRQLNETKILSPIDLQADFRE